MGHLRVRGFGCGRHAQRVGGGALSRVECPQGIKETCMQLKAQIIMALTSSIFVVACGSDSTVEVTSDAGSDSGTPMLTTGGISTSTGGSITIMTPTSTGGTSSPKSMTSKDMKPQDTPTSQLDDDAGMDDMLDAGDMLDATIELPTDGNALSLCTKDADCNGDDLVCVIFSTYRGYCADDCKQDSDCPALEGIAATCSSNECVVDCAGSGNGDGACPTNMECVQASSGLSSSYRCQYPEPKDKAVYEPCDGLRGNADCQEGLTCDVFIGLPLLSDLASPHCVEPCMDASDCSDPGSKATLVCDRDSVLVSEGQCALECANDKDCPGDMLCLAISPLQLRCGYSP